MVKGYFGINLMAIAHKIVMLLPGGVFNHNFIRYKKRRGTA